MKAKTRRGAQVHERTLKHVEARLAAFLEELMQTVDERVKSAFDERMRLVFEARDADRLGGLAELAKWIGAPSVDAARKTMERDADLAALAVRTAGGHRRWGATRLDDDPTPLAGCINQVAYNEGELGRAGQLNITIAAEFDERPPLRTPLDVLRFLERIGAA